MTQIVEQTKQNFVTVINGTEYFVSITIKINNKRNGKITQKFTS